MGTRQVKIVGEYFLLVVVVLDWLNGYHTM